MSVTCKNWAFPGICYSNLWCRTFGLMTASLSFVFFVCSSREGSVSVWPLLRTLAFPFFQLYFLSSLTNFRCSSYKSGFCTSRDATLSSVFPSLRKLSFRIYGGSPKISGITRPTMHGLFVVYIGSALVLCSPCSSLCVPTGDDTCSTVGVMATTRMLTPENDFTAHSASRSQNWVTCCLLARERDR